MRLDVQILAAHGAETGAVRVVQDLVRELERERVVRPRGQIEQIVRDVRRAQLLVVSRLCRLVLLRGDRHLEGGIGEAAEAGALEAHPEGHVHHRAGARLRDREVGRDERRLRCVLLSPEHERLDLDLHPVAELVAAAQPELAQVEGRHLPTVARCPTHGRCERG